MNELNELRVKAQAWLDELNQRERRLVIGGGVFLVVFILYQLLWAPFADGAADLQDKVARQQQDLLWMQQSAQEIKSLQGNGQHQPLQGGSLLGLIEMTARQRGLGASIRKVQPEGQNGVRMWLDKVSFDAVLSWLDELQTKQGVTISSFTAEGLAQPGWVNVRMLVEAP